MDIQQNKILNVRLSPQIYEMFEKKAIKIGLRPSTLLRHFIISIALADIQKSFSQFLSSLSSREIDEERIFKLINKERKSLYQK